jgi:hypothetical protein
MLNLSAYTGAHQASLDSSAQSPARKPVLFLRYNPQPYKNRSGKMEYTPIGLRTKILLRWLAHYKKPQTDLPLVGVVQLFFDRFDVVKGMNVVDVFAVLETEDGKDVIPGGLPPFVGVEEDDVEWVEEDGFVEEGEDDEGSVEDGESADEDESIEDKAMLDSMESGPASESSEEELEPQLQRKRRRTNQ